MKIIHRINWLSPFNSSISTGQAIPSKDGVGDERFTPLSEQKLENMDLRHPHDRVGDERHNTLFEERWRVKQGQGQAKAEYQGGKGI